MQGEESFVKVRRLKVAESRVLLKSLKTQKKEMAAVRRDKALSDEEKELRLEELEAEQNEKAFEAMLRQYIDHVLEWNWVDDDGKPLAQPCPEVLDDLTNDEIRFLGEALAGDTDEKN